MIYKQILLVYIVGPLWETNIDAQFILDPYTIVVYCTFYLTNVDKLSHKKCKSYWTNVNVKKLKHLNELKTKKCIFKCMTNVNSTSSTIIFIHPIISFNKTFQFINTCEENDRAYVLLPQKILNKLFPNLIDIHCNSLIEKYKTRNQSLNHISLGKVVADFDTKSSKQCKHNKIIHRVSLNLHKYLENYYRELLL
jgi:hypothetical protein